MEKICSAHDTNHLFIGYDWYALDSMPLHEFDDLVNRSAFSYRVGIRRHDFSHLRPEGADIFRCQSAGADQKFQPAGAAALRSDLAATQEITFRNYADKPVCGVDHWQPADPVQQHDLRGAGNRFVCLEITPRVITSCAFMLSSWFQRSGFHP
jgi:hypothetical protein